MPAMPDFLADLAAAGHDVGALLGHRPHPQTPAPQRATLKAQPKENPMSLAADLHDVADVLGQLPADAVHVLKDIASNKAALDLLLTLGKVAAPAVGVDPAIFGAVRTMLDAYAPQPARAQAPAAQAGQAQQAPAAQ